MRALLAAGGLAIAPPPHSPFTPQRSPPSSSPRNLKSSLSFDKPRHCWPPMTSSRASHEVVEVKSSTNSVAITATGVTDSSNFSHLPAPSLLVFSGGTAFNGVVEELKKFTTRVAHVLPVSDDGGSTSEIVRVLGGPAVGDIRSRCLRLSDESTAEALAVKTLLGYRLSLNESEAKAEWCEIVKGEHALWQGVSGPYRETIRAFLVHFHTRILRHSNARFNFRNGSIGNFFFAGARIFLQSMEAAIFLYSRVCQCPPDSLVLPAICTNDRLTLGSELHNGTIIRGQNEISHPMAAINDQGVASQAVSKHAPIALPSPIKRIFYMSSEQTNLMQEVFPIVNAAVLDQLRQVDAVVYGIGSLYTSICPSLVLRGVGECIAKRTCPKVLIVNGTHDRETSGMSVSDFVIAVSDALNRKYCNDPKRVLHYPACRYINVVLVPKGGDIPVDKDKLDALHIWTVTEVDSIVDGSVGTIFQPKSLIRALHDAVHGCHLVHHCLPL